MRFVLSVFALVGLLACEKENSTPPPEVQQATGTVVPVPTAVSNTPTPVVVPSVAESTTEPVVSAPSNGT